MVAAEKQQFNIYLPAALIRRVKHASVDANQSLSAFVQEALEEYLRTLDRQDGEES
ncbi:MAG: ribbon-helix-helix protein, CopG family [Pseudonocardiaceae bacterium]|nr:ribbon-helix-helix protein, CopG family [Pseudonocardiaceae bacterium]